ncbi:MAG: HAD hydrolase-like protein [Eubacteriales bacterium]|nr:HAD hydrolase-like protein [Eubacteriales bacterium]
MDIFKEKKCFIFDFDGTLADSIEFWDIYGRSKPDLAHFYEYMKDIYKDVIQPIPGSLEFVKHCHDTGKKCYIATATDLKVCGGCIERLGYDKYVEKSFCCRDFGVRKTEGFYKKVAEATGFDIKDIVIFEDNTEWARVAYNDGFDIAAVYERHNTAFDELASFAVLTVTDFNLVKKQTEIRMEALNG